MKKIFFTIGYLLILFACNPNPAHSYISSPDKNINLNFFVNQHGEAGYLINFKIQQVIDTSYFSFDFQNEKSFGKNLEVINSSESSFDETWETVWGEQRFIRNNYNELKVELKEKGEEGRRCFIVFRVFNDGVGFRFEFPEQENLNDVVILDENTQFKLTGDNTCWWTPGDWDIYEHLFNTTRFTEIDALSKRSHRALAQTYIPENAVNLPVTMKTDDGIYISILEANLTDYADMTLKVDKENLLFQCELVGNDSGIKVKTKTPFVTPWRLILICDKATDLVSSRTILNLNEPNKLEDVSPEGMDSQWIKPTKYVGIWWEMHLGKSTWDMKSGRHGATTENAKRYIDFASKNGIGAVLVEGWNTGWDHYLGKEKRDFIFDFVTPYPDYDLKDVVRYAKEKNVQIIMHKKLMLTFSLMKKDWTLLLRCVKVLVFMQLKQVMLDRLFPMENIITDNGW